MDNNDKMDYVTRPELMAVDQRLTAEVKENRDYIDEHSREIARLEAVYRSLESLPGTIANLDKTITVIGSNLESMDKNLNDVRQSVSNQEQAIKEIRGENKTQNESIERIDNKSKVDWAEFVTNNFWKILCAVAVGYAIIKTLIDGGV